MPSLNSEPGGQERRAKPGVAEDPSSGPKDSDLWLGYSSFQHDEEANGDFWVWWVE